MVWDPHPILVLPQVQRVMVAPSLLLLGSTSPSVHAGRPGQQSLRLCPALTTQEDEGLTYHNQVEHSFWTQVDSGESIFPLEAMILHLT